MDRGFLLFAVFALGVLSLALWRRQVRLGREAFIRAEPLPPGLFDKLRQQRPELTLKDCQLVAHALRQFFLAYLKGGRRPVAMPSQVVDELWHEFIVYTRHYQRFCGRAFGGFLHHTPAVALGPEKRSNEGLRRCFWWACKEEHINPRAPTRMPLLFAIDAKLKIANGYVYVPDCSDLRRNGSGGTQCGGDFASSGFDGGTDGFGDGAGGDGGSGGDGCSGGGCGGE